MDKADFYVGIGPDAEWIGSVSKCGSPFEMLTEMLLQVNQTMYEELVIEYINYCEGVVANHICQWPWQWPDSRMTDYSYFFVPEHEKVYVSIGGDVLLDPIKLIQHGSISEADTHLGPPVFPMMVECECYKDDCFYGQTPTTPV